MNPDRGSRASQCTQGEVVVIQNIKFAIRHATGAAKPAIAALILAFDPTILTAESTPASQSPPSNSEIHKILCERIGEQERSAGIIVGVIEPQGRRIISYGHRDIRGDRPLDGDTVFEIASVTKVFTALLLGDMVEKNEVALSDAAAKYLPADLKLPERNGRAITLVDLATHTSGLPFLPANAPPMNDPAAAKYSETDLNHYVANYQLTRDIGAEWDYSNLGYWVLSEALATRGRERFQDMLRERILAPLKMANTDFNLSPKMKANLAPGHDNALQPAPNFSALGIYSLMPSGGGLYSSVNDLLSFLSAAMEYENSKLASAIKLTVNTRRPASGGSEQALGWTIYGTGDDPIVFRDGSSYGSASAIAWDPKRRAGVVVLMNRIGDVGDIARHLLRPDFPLAKLTNTKHIEIAIDPALLDSYAGRYEAKGEGIFTVVREDDFLTIESPADWGLPKMRIRPESPRDFFAAELPLRVSFQREISGRATGLLIYPPRGQKAVPATRLRTAK